MTILSHEHAAVFRSGSKRLLWSEVERIFQLRTCSCFSSLDRRGCFGAKLNGFSASNMQLFFLSGSKRLLWSEVERFFSYEHAAVFRSGSKRLLWSEVERFFSLEHAAIFPLWIEEAALERS